jgi:hypothetical protein
MKEVLAEDWTTDDRQACMLAPHLADEKNDWSFVLTASK